MQHPYCTEGSWKSYRRIWKPCTGFRHSSSRRESLKDIHHDLDLIGHIYKRYVPTQWVSVGSVMKQWSVMLKMMKDFSMHLAKVKQVSQACSQIQLKLARPKHLHSQLKFMKMFSVFEEFLLCFQSKELTNSSHPMMDLVRRLMSRYIKKKF